ncbi:outer membrane protein assembly factor BamE [Zhongshania aliphaticivorans]|uniref:outer membrane protein assembly factor BamE n=1 Tax=Zhongshania aliphaticivorans TaxID=1470434 RepID=UPI0012E60197|nr:outer membrane protein assembly factor BamE [Zhongshania aliphaticivorans]CAA0094097.1 Outer membrane protein assembly factor BamE [Zhongshania aliphaticivorans]
MYRQLATACLLVSLAACSSLEFPGVYRLPIDQGNIITQEMVDQLKIGMTRSQVEYVMGTPLVRDTFNPNRWDYVYTLDDRNNDKTERHQLTVKFVDGKLSEFTTDIKPTSETTPAEQVNTDAE